MRITNKHIKIAKSISIFLLIAAVLFYFIFSYINYSFYQSNPVQYESNYEKMDKASQIMADSMKTVGEFEYNTFGPKTTGNGSYDIFEDVSSGHKKGN